MSDEPSISGLLSNGNDPEPRFVRLHGADFTTAELLSEVSVMANKIIGLIPEATLHCTDPAAWSIREVASKWDSIQAYPEMLRDIDAELLKILVLDAYPDLERIGGNERMGNELC